MEQAKRKSMKRVHADTFPVIEILQRLGLGRTPEAQAVGLDKGNYMQVAHDQIETFMRKDQPEHIRYYAWLLRQSLGFALLPYSRNKKTGVIRYHGRCAMKMQSGRKVPAAMIDAARDLFMDKSNIHRAQQTLERLGMARRATDSIGRVLLFVYVKPRRTGGEARFPGETTGNASDPAKCSFNITYELPTVKTKIEIFIRTVVSRDSPPIAGEACRPIMAQMIADYAPRIQQALQPFAVVRPDHVQESRETTPLKEEIKVMNADAKQQHQQQAAAAPVYLWHNSLKKAQSHYPTVGQKFIHRLVELAKKHRPAVTDAELAGALVRKPDQKSEGLWTLTIPEAMQALNENRVTESPLDVIARAKAEEAARK